MDRILPRPDCSRLCQYLDRASLQTSIHRLTPPPIRTMVSVASLLNPTTPETQPPNPLPRPCSTRYSPGPPRRVPLARKPKLCKDEATFIKGKPQEEVRYWPCEEQGGHIAAEHQKFKLYPIGHITEYCKHVPYRSEKKAFLNKTGREGFHGNFRPSERVSADS